MAVYYSNADASGSGGGSSIASYVTVSAEASLPNSRKLQPGAFLSTVDHGPGGDVDLVVGGVVPSGVWTASTLTGPDGYVAGWSGGVPTTVIMNPGGSALMAAPAPIDSGAVPTWNWASIVWAVVSIIGNFPIDYTSYRDSANVVLPFTFSGLIDA